MLVIAAMADDIRGAAPRCGPVRLVAVDGPGGAGKTTFTARLARAIGTPPVVHCDDFYLPMDGDPLRWWGPFAAGVLTPLRAGRAGRFRRYDWRRGRYTGYLDVPPDPIVLVEGVGAAWRGCAPYLSRAVWVRAPTRVRVDRTARRDGPGLADLWAAWRAAEQAHFATDRTRERADVVVDGTATPH